MPWARSTYRWKGKVERAREVVLVIKTRASLAKRMERRVRELHPYDVPEILALPVASGDARYLRWIGESSGAAMNFFSKVILASVVVLLVAAAVVILFRSREGARVEALLREAATWAERGEVDRVEALIDEDFDSGADWARREIRRYIRPGAFEKVEITRLDVGVHGDESRVRIDVRILAREFPYPHAESLRLTLRRRDGGWKITGAERPEPAIR